MKKYWRLVALTLIVLALAGMIWAKRSADNAKKDRYLWTPPQPTAAQRVAGLPTLLDLGSDSCIPCKMMAPILNELARDYAGRVNVVVIDVQQHRDEAMKYSVYAIPTQIFFDAEGTELFRHEGFLDKAAIEARFRDLGMVK